MSAETGKQSQGELKRHLLSPYGCSHAQCNVNECCISVKDE